MNDANSTKIIPLEEKHILDSLNGELIVDGKSAHYTININGKYKSKTKELEALVDSLIKTKNDLLRRYMRLVDIIDELVKFKRTEKEVINDLLARKQSLYEQLIKLNVIVDDTVNQFDDFYMEYLKFLYVDLNEIMLRIKENLKKLIFIKYTIMEMEFLLGDWNQQLTFNNNKQAYANS